jgi:hypothetical protein
MDDALDPCAHAVAAQDRISNRRGTVKELSVNLFGEPAVRVESGCPNRQ